MILLTNDDGIFSDGIRALREAIVAKEEAIVVAPDSEQSAVGHAITISNPLRVKETHFNGEFWGYAVSGTPADCVKIAVGSILEEPPKIVISGINHGGNLGTCVIYSGTVSAATEAAILGIPSIAVSLNDFENLDFSFAASFIAKFYPQVLAMDLPKGIVINVNVPAVPESEIKGVVFAKQGGLKVVDQFEKRKDPRNSTYYWMSGDVVLDPNEKNTDGDYVSQNYVTITPVHYDLTHYETLEKLKDLKIDWE